MAEGKLSLTDTIASRLPQLPAAWGAVTLAELLQHTGGAPDYTKNRASVAALQRDPSRPVAPMTLIDYVANEPLEFAPGSQYHYSDTDNLIVASCTAILGAFPATPPLPPARPMGSVR